MTESILNALSSPWPLDWSQLFGRQAPVIVEIGFGSGAFLKRLAADQPGANVVGIEISLPSLRRARRKILRSGLQNVRLVQAAAASALWLLFPPASIAGMHINFPDPWPKSVHLERRLVGSRFLHLAASRLAAGAALKIATDSTTYAAAIAADLLRSHEFQSSQPAPFSAADSDRIRTKYEQRAIAEGRACSYFHWERNPRPPLQSFPIPPEWSMPHIVIASSMSLEEIGRRFVPLQWSDGETHIRLLEVFLALHSPRLIVDAYINEPAVQQRLGLQVRQASSDTFVVGLHQLGFPRPTTGVHYAVRLLANWLIEQAPDSRVLKTNLRPLPEQVER